MTGSASSEWLLRLLKANAATAAIPVIIRLSSLGGDGDIQAALKQGAVSYFLKSHLSVQTLVGKVQEALGTGQPRVGD